MATQTQTQTGSQTQEIQFKPGERIAVQWLLLARIDDTTGVAVIDKTRPGVWGACGARHEVRISAPFFVRGGFRVERREVCVVEADSIFVKFAVGGAIGSGYVPRSPLIYESCDGATIERVIRDSLGERYRILETEVRKEFRKAIMYYRRFKHGEWMYVTGSAARWRYDNASEWKDETPWMVYEFVTPTEARLVDDTSRIDYVMLRLYHAVESRSFCATIKLLGGDVVWHKTASTCCAIKSVAVGIVIARYGSRIVLTLNDPPYRGGSQDWRVEEWEMTFPPRVIRQRYSVPEEDLTAYVSEEIPAEDIV